MKTTLTKSILFILGLVLFTINACKKDSASSTPEINQPIDETQNCLMNKMNSDSIKYNPDSSIYAYGYIFFKRFGDTVHTQFYGMPYFYIVYDNLNRPVNIRPYYDNNSNKLYTYIGETDQISSVESFNYSYDSLNVPILSYYYKINFAYIGDKITSANYEFINLSKNIPLLKGTFSYSYSNKYIDNRIHTFQKLIVLGSNPINEITLFSKYPVSKIIDSQNTFNTIFTYEFDANGKITKQIMNTIGSEPEITNYSYSCK